MPECLFRKFPNRTNKTTIYLYIQYSQFTWYPMEMFACKRLFVICSKEREKNNTNKIFICFQVLFYVVLRSFLVMLSVHFNLDFITFTINIIFFESSVCFFILWNAERSVFQGKWTRNTKDGRSKKTKSIICLRNLFLQPIVLFVTFSLILSSKWLG